MAYIPTIHTFEDDINENRNLDDTPITGGLDKIESTDSILIPEKEESSVAKKLLILISMIFILGSIAMVGYYFYTQNKQKQAEAALNAEALAKEIIINQNDTSVSDISKALPLLSPKVSQYISSFKQNKNTIILTIKPNNETGTDNYSNIYTYILAHKNDLNNDLIYAFDLNNQNNNQQSIGIANQNINNEATTSTSTNQKNSTSSEKVNNKTINNLKSSVKNTQNNVVDFFDTTKLQDTLSSAAESIADQSLISAQDIIWENKTLNNQDFEIANAGVVTLIYGYAKNNKYIIFTTSIKDFFDTISGL